MLPGQPLSLRALGVPYTRLLHDLAASDALKPFRLADASRLAAEAEGGFNIEGLAATPEGKLLIGLRNPLPQRRALVVPLENPAELVEGKTVRDELARIGYIGDEVPGQHPIGAYFEAHIEQGPVLEDAGVTIGVVEGVLGIPVRDEAWLRALQG